MHCKCGEYGWCEVRVTAAIDGYVVGHVVLDSDCAGVLVLSCFLTWADPREVALFPTLKASSSFSILLFILFGGGLTDGG